MDACEEELWIEGRHIVMPSGAKSSIRLHVREKAI